MTPGLDTNTILSQLKDFQRNTVEYVFRRLYLDDDCVRRFLVADEVGLGKTLIARGLIAKTIEHLRDRTARIDIVYVCSNTDIARQNIARLNVTGHDDFTLSSRITLLPITLKEFGNKSLNFVSFTPGTSFDLKDSSGRSDERELLYWMVADAWNASFKRATRVFEGYAETEGFRKRVERFPTRHEIHAEIRDQFLRALANLHPQLRQQFEALSESLPRAGVAVPHELRRERNLFIGQMRRVLAETCLHWLEPDLIILDEFQRFKHLLSGDADNASDAAQLAHHLFSFQQDQNDPATAARVVLLSATPYKMYTLTHESDQDDHYADFRQTLEFLMADPERQQHFHKCIAAYREALLGVVELGAAPVLNIKRDLEQALGRVMVRTERLAVSADRNGILVDVPCETATLDRSDVLQYLSVQGVARALNHEDLLEYWKSSPYLLNFMDEYDLKRKFRGTAEASEPVLELARAVHQLKSGLLDPEQIAAYGEVDPSNARLRWLQRDTIERGAWKLLWIPPSLPYYEGDGSFSDPCLGQFTKRLIFSCWKVVPKAIAALLSYAAERRMMHCFRRKAANTPEARKLRKPLLRFAFSKGRPTGLPVLGLLYPSRVLATSFDPLEFRSTGASMTADDAVAATRDRIAPLLEKVIGQFSQPDGQTDERWYWAAAMLLDLTDDPVQTRVWFQQPALDKLWDGGVRHADHKAARGWSRHVNLARELILNPPQLGPPPVDLLEVVAQQTLAGFGTVALRGLNRTLSGWQIAAPATLQNSAAALAHSFLHLFNLPEVTYLLRDRSREMPYWRSVLQYCVSGNLQSVVDEYLHTLLESLGLVDSPADKVATKLGEAFHQVLTLRTATAQADVITAGPRRVRIDEQPLRMRTRFAMRFGDHKAEDSEETTRPDQVRAAFNSPFWPFVLATTSVGQEGLDFHPYCHAIVHWNIPSNPVDLEQREGRIHRYKNHAVRKNVASHFGPGLSVEKGQDAWISLFQAARDSRDAGTNDLFPFWTAACGASRIERHVPALPLSQDARRLSLLKRSLVLYRMVFGQNRQEDLVEYLLKHLPEQSVAELVEICRIDLSAPRMIGHDAPEPRV